MLSREAMQSYKAFSTLIEQDALKRLIFAPNESKHYNVARLRFLWKIRIYKCSTSR